MPSDSVAKRFGAAKQRRNTFAMKACLIELAIAYDRIGIAFHPHAHFNLVGVGRWTSTVFE
ncbi:hypothetical protein [Variovorax sp. EBFNA2]|uniref:hypothetical protein n=1 Tax=Variovorax sp. EBFNA2 TaxID=3342097 RepID=UPI0029BFA94D|nr:hypothetical protein [Variovorax boronicumulans]WPG41109.1 hypothetical protein RZE79_34020 [Variovorax boronicumulans]